MSQAIAGYGKLPQAVASHCGLEQTVVRTLRRAFHNTNLVQILRISALVPSCTEPVTSAIDRSGHHFSVLQSHYTLAIKWGNTVSESDLQHAPAVAVTSHRVTHEHQCLTQSDPESAHARTRFGKRESHMRFARDHCMRALVAQTVKHNDLPKSYQHIHTRGACGRSHSHGPPQCINTLPVEPTATANSCRLFRAIAGYSELLHAIRGRRK